MSLAAWNDRARQDNRRKKLLKNAEKSVPSKRHEWSNDMFLKFGMGEKCRMLESRKDF